MLLGNHEGRYKQIQGTQDPRNPPFVCGGLPNFVELREGGYFFIPSMTALRMYSAAVDRLLSAFEAGRVADAGASGFNMTGEASQVLRRFHRSDGEVIPARTGRQ
jgi:hypothetical protein